jgi:hypothetical protein
MATRKIITGVERNKRGTVTAVTTTKQKRGPLSKDWKDVSETTKKVPWFKR